MAARISGLICTLNARGVLISYLLTRVESKRIPAAVLTARAIGTVLVGGH